ncbi:MAG: hypothetical protein Q9184_001142 [Pyrenodesmia sp. 2 TL-2023]
MVRGKGPPRGADIRLRAKTKGVDDSLNPAYREMLAEVEAESSTTQTGDEGRPLKRRRVRGRGVASEEGKAGPSKSVSISPKSVPGHPGFPKEGQDSVLSEKEIHMQMSGIANHPLRREQVAYKDETSDESDFAWEEVDLAQDADQSVLEPADGDGEQDLNLVLDDDGKHKPNPSVPARRKVLTAVEKKLRVDLHKVHLLCLLYHVHLRNHWCNDQNVHQILYHRLPKQVVSLLNPDDTLPQFRQDEAFREGLRKAMQYFHDAFTVTARGMSRAYWADDPGQIPTQPPTNLELPMQKPDFIECAKKLEGSRDVGAQLFCALLRSAGVETRLVCSLQLLPLTATTKGATPQKPPPKPIPVIDYSDTSTSSNPPPLNLAPPPSIRPIGSTGGLTRFSNPSAATPPLSRPPLPQKPKTQTTFPSSPAPVFWLEAFNTATQTHVPLSLFPTPTLNKPLSLTPTLHDPLNSLTYCIAFSASLAAKDVTRRYTRAYAAKTLKTRIDSSPRGNAWLASVLALFRYPSSKYAKKSDREEIEDHELARKEAAEPMPRAVADFNHHPVYALERHLKRNEVVWPRREVGKVSAGVGGKLEGVFSRRNVLVCRTAAQWFRLGREVKPGEQALKRLPPSKRRGHVEEDEDDDAGDEETEGKALYAEFQTTQYTPPPIPPSGRPIPCNAFHNLDIYKPSMVPARGHHSTHALTSLAAKILGIDAVDAVTGFTFSGKGRSGKAVVTGAVIWEGHREAVDAVIEGLEDRAREEEEARWRGVVLGAWKRMLVGLRVRERVKGYEIEGERGEVEREERERVEEVEEDEEEGGGFQEGGGFLPERAGEEAPPTAGAGARMLLANDDSEDSDVYVPSEEDGEYSTGRRKRLSAAPRTRRTPTISPVRSQGGGFVREDEQAGGFLTEDGDLGGGFMAEDHEPEAGGFLPDDSNRNEDIKAERAGSARNEQSHSTGTANTPDAEIEEQLLSPQPPPTLQEKPGTQQNALAANDQPFEEEENKNNSVNVGETLDLHRSMTDAEMEEGRMLAELYDRGELGSVGAPLGGTLPEQRPNEVKDVDDGKIGDDAAKHPGVAKGEGAENRGEINVDPSSEEDKGSLLSEDPDDEDAEPDWLM